MQETAKQSF